MSMSALMFSCTPKHETELNSVAVKMEEESFFETSEEADCPTSWNNTENPLIQQRNMYKAWNVWQSTFRI